jgi:hypothetical protein
MTSSLDAGAVQWEGGEMRETTSPSGSQTTRARGGKPPARGTVGGSATSPPGARATSVISYSLRPMV